MLDLYTRSEKRSASVSAGLGLMRGEDPNRWPQVSEATSTGGTVTVLVCMVETCASSRRICSDAIGVGTA